MGKVNNMQTITFTTDDKVSQLLQDIANENNKPTGEIIAESLRYYAEMLQKKTKPTYQLRITLSR